MRGAVLLALAVTVLDPGPAFPQPQADPAPENVGKPAPVTGQATAAGHSNSPASKAHILQFRVVDARTKAPLSDVSIVLIAGGAVGGTALRTGEHGRCRIEMPEHLAPFLGISARKEGFVPVRVEWRGPRIDAVLPDAYTMALEAGTSIGGTVRDTRGQPVAGARVYVWLERERPGPAREHIYLEDGYHVETDAQGRWRCSMMPADLVPNDRLLFRLIHPDYVSEPLAFRRNLPIYELRAMTAVMVMEDGILLTGRVVNSGGQPIVGARVVLQVPGFEVNPDRLTPDQAACMRAETDADGR
jgi:hypothetical protein